MPNHFGDLLIPMTTLATKVEEFAARCHADKLYTSNGFDDVSFVSVDLSDLLNDPGLGSITGLVLKENRSHYIHMLNPWSRHQLLSTVGTKEKWFSTVTREQEAAELNLRRSTLLKHRFRTMDAVEGSVRILRGIVSDVYGDIPDTDIMKVLLELMPDGQVVKYLSDKTDKALYVHAISDKKIGIPGTKFHGYPGIVIKNSEVGFTSLWVIPILYLPGYRLSTVFERHVLLRRTHRGTMSEMKAQFTDALDRAAAVWKETNTRMTHLTKIKFADSDTTIAELRRLIIECGGSKMLAHRAAQAYQTLAPNKHDGSTLLAALLEVVEKTDADDAYLQAAVAGAVLWRLTT